MMEQKKEPWVLFLFIGAFFIILAAIKLTMPLKAIIAAIGFFNIIFAVIKMKIPNIGSPQEPKSFEDTWEKSLEKK